MRPYAAVIVDSFREALHSRVLWLLLGLITLLLLLLVPLGVTFPVTTDFRRGDIKQLQPFAKRLQAANGAAENAPNRIVWEKLSEDLQTQLQKVATAKDRNRRDEITAGRALVKEFNELLEKKDLFTEEQLADIGLRGESKKLLEIGAEKRSQKQSQRLNRLALEKVFERDLEKVPSKSVLLTYLGMSVGSALPLSGDDFESAVKMVLLVFMNGIAAPVGVLVAILVTASIIPNMFDAGSVNLLFSKPIMRPLLFLAKFFGGCWFVLINASYLIGGLWVIIGWRLGVWHAKLLWVIPILTFLFAVYYTVSSLAGVVWRNTIMAVVAAILFWALCFGTGMAHDLMDRLMVAPKQIVKVVMAGETPIQVCESGVVNAWDKEDRKWVTAFAAKSNEIPEFALNNRLLGPIYDESNERIVAIDRNWSQTQLLAGYAEQDWDREEIDKAPNGCLALGKSTDGTFVIVDREGISRMEESKKKQTKDLNLFGMKYTLGPKRGSLQSIAPKNFDGSGASAAAVNPDDGSIVLYANEALRRYSTDANGKYDLTGEHVLAELPEDSNEMDAVIAAAGQLILVANEDGLIRLLSSDAFEPLGEFTPFPRMEPRFAIASPGGKYVAVLFHNKKAWLYDVENSKDLSARMPSQGKLTSLNFAAVDRMVYSDRIRQVAELKLPAGKTTATYAGSLPLLEKVFFYLIRPMYEIFPKPGKLKETAGYLLTEEESMAATENDSLEGARVKVNPWPPVWHSAGFMLIMLLITCIYIQRQEF